MTYKYLLLTLFILLISFTCNNLNAAVGTDTQNSLLKMEKNGVRNADLYNQIGLSYYQTGKSGKATLYFLRALRLQSNHHDAKNNLDYAISGSLDRDLYSQPSFLPGMFQKLFDFFTLNMLAILTLILLIITILCIHWLLHLNISADKAIPIMWLVIFGFIFMISAFMLGLKFKDFNSNSKAVIIETMVDGYSGPGAEYGKIFTIHEGLIVQISRTDKGWSLVTLPNGGAGWVSASSMERVKP